MATPASSYVTEASPSVTKLQNGDLAKWLGGEFQLHELGMQFHKDALIVTIFKGNYFYETYLQIQDVPFLSRRPGEPAVALQIAEGATNTVDLNFKIGAVTQVDKYSWDKEVGRIEINIARFYVRDNTTGDWLERSVQGLNVPAVTSYMQAYLTPEQQAADTPVLLKITGVSLTYEGKVTERISAIVIR